VALIITARLDTLSPQDVLDRSGAVPLVLMLAASTVPTMVLAATDRTAHDDEDEDEDELR
jgi:hypothetical protein